MVFMLADDVLEMIFSHPEMHRIPLGTQATAVRVMTDIIEKIKEDEPYAGISRLLSTDAVSGKHL
jgi:hypothetical protein